MWRTGCVLSVTHHIPVCRALGEDGIFLSFIVTVFCLVVLDYSLSVSMDIHVWKHVKELIKSSETMASLLQHLSPSFEGHGKHYSPPVKKAGMSRGFSVKSTACLTMMHVSGSHLQIIMFY